MTNGKSVVLILNIIIGVVETLLSLRLILKLFGASPQAPFVTWVYETSAPLLTPFVNMFPSPRVEGLFILEFSTLFALGVYAFVGYILIELVSVTFQPPHRSK